MPSKGGSNKRLEDVLHQGLSLAPDATQPLGNLSYGRVEGAGLTHGYTIRPVISTRGPAKSDDYPDQTLMCTTLPSQLATASLDDDPSGWTECLLRGFTKRTILSTNGFPQPPTKPTNINYRIGPTPQMGLGMFATRDLSMGDHILTERPLIVTPNGTPIDLPTFPRHFTLEQQRQVVILEWEKWLEICFNRLEPENQAAFSALANSHTEDGSGPIFGVIRTNGFQIEGLEDPVTGGFYVAVCNDMSRINHSCRPSADRLFDIPSFSFQLRATRDIDKDEEIFISYCDLLVPSAERQMYLAPYGIKCMCISCLPDTADSDKRRFQLRESIKDIKTYLEIWIQDPLLADDFTIKISLAWISVIEQEGLQVSDAYRHHLNAIIYAYAALGDRVNVMKYGRLLGLWYLVQSGKPDKLRDMADLQFIQALPAWERRVFIDEQ